MTYEEFLQYIKSDMPHETIYEDSEGRLVLVIRALDAYLGMMELTKQQERTNELFLRE